MLSCTDDDDDEEISSVVEAVLPVALDEDESPQSANRLRLRGTGRLMDAPAPIGAVPSDVDEEEDDIL